jgi:hypothetical protein
MSVQKTQSLVIAKQPRRCKLAVYNKSRSPDQVMIFKYLGANQVIETSKKEMYKQTR